MSAQEPMARPFAAVATEVATVAAARLPANVCRARKIPRRGAATSSSISKDGAKPISALGNQELPRRKAPTRTALTS